MIYRILVTEVLISLLFLTNGHTKGAIRLEPIDVNNVEESGEGAGCIFEASVDKVTQPIFVDRDDFGWIKMGKKIIKMRPMREGIVMWPSIVGKRLTLHYESGENHVILDIHVASGCASESEDNCDVKYAGELTITGKKNVESIPVTGYCVH